MATLSDGVRGPTGHHAGMAGTSPRPLTRLTVVAGPSIRMRDAALGELIAGWQGPVARLVEPSDLGRVLLEVETPSLFGEPTLRVVRCDDKYLKKHQAILASAIGAPAECGALVMVTPAIDQREKFAKALLAANALLVVPSPDAKTIQAWLLGHLRAAEFKVDDPAAVAQALIEQIGADVDGILSVLEVAALYAEPAPVGADHVTAVCGGVGERPPWEYTAAVLEGRAGRALDLTYAGEGLVPQVALSSLVSELRKLLACCDSSDDAEAAALAGLKGRPNLYYARKRARELEARAACGCCRARSRPSGNCAAPAAIPSSPWNCWPSMPHAWRARPASAPRCDPSDQPAMRLTSWRSQVATQAEPASRTGMNVYFCDVCGVRVTDTDPHSGHGMRRRNDVTRAASASSSAMARACSPRTARSRWRWRAPSRPPAPPAPMASIPLRRPPRSAAWRRRARRPRMCCSEARDRARTLDEDQPPSSVKPVSPLGAPPPGLEADSEVDPRGRDRAAARDPRI